MAFVTAESIVQEKLKQLNPGPATLTIYAGGGMRFNLAFRNTIIPKVVKFEFEFDPDEMAIRFRESKDGIELVLKKNFSVNKLISDEYTLGERKNVVFTVSKKEDGWWYCTFLEFKYPEKRSCAKR